MKINPYRKLAEDLGSDYKLEGILIYKLYPYPWYVCVIPFMWVWMLGEFLFNGNKWGYWWPVGTYCHIINKVLTDNTDLAQLAESLEYKVELY